MAVNMVDVGAKYPFAFTDAQGNFLSGSKSYRLHLSAQGHSCEALLVGYGAYWPSGLDNGQLFPSINAMDKPATNADGSTDVYFGPASPGDGKNWLRTVPDKVYFVIVGLDGPTEPFFNQTWRPGDLEELK
jgi:hypothetical protein